MKKILTFLSASLLLLITFNGFSASSDDLLRPDAAFKGSISQESPESIQAIWDIADGYYMYRKRFSFKSDTAGITLGTPVFPKGKMKEDPGFGKVETYRHKIVVNIPIKRDSSAPTSFTLKTKSQGCADIGVCYPPQKKVLTLQLATLKTETPKTSKIEASPKKGFNLAKELGISTLGDINAPLHPDKAFGFDIVADDSQNLTVRWSVTPGHYLYQHKLGFSITKPATGVTISNPILPEGNAHNDQYYGNIITYNKNFDVKLPLIGSADSATVKVKYQGCSKLTGICYPPQIKTQTIDLSSTKAGISSNVAVVTTAVGIAAVTDTTSNTPAPTKVSEQDDFANKLKSGNFLTSLALFFLAGLALTFTPCVFPMIPILSGIIAGQGTDNSTKKSFFLSLSYVIVMALTYAIVGVIAALSGENLQVALQNPWVIGAFAGLFVLLSLAMFGFYELQMPAGIQSKLTNISNSQTGGSMMNAGIMGFLSALIVGPCVTAPLIGALIYIAQTKDVVLGGLSLFALGLGMGVPLMIIGTSAGKILPRAGAWMDTVKAGFGIMMLALAIWMLERIAPMSVIMLLSGILAVFSAIYMGALDALSEASSGWKRFFKASGLVTLLYGAMLLFGAASGNGSLIQPLKGGFSSSSVSQQQKAEQSLIFKQIKGIEGLNKSLALAKQQGKTVMLDFYADWCISCKEMEHFTFSDTNVINTLKNTILLQADVTPNDDQDKALLKKFGLFGPPGILFFDKNSQENKAYRIVGEMKASPFDDHVNQFLNTIK
jgi:thiol:disulfide interchange protein DsbD